MKRTMVFAFFAVLMTAAWVNAGDAVTQQEKTPSAPEKKEAPGKKESLASDFLKDENAYRGLLEFLTALSIVKDTYVDADKATYERLFKAALSGMLHELDPYSNYETEEQYRETRQETRGETAGIAVVVTMRNQVLEIVEVQAGGPAFKAGLKPGDLILEIDGESLNGKTLRDCTRMLRGKAGESVRLTVYRSRTDAKQEFTLVREQIVLPSIMGARLLDRKSGTGYVRILHFGGKTAGELNAAVKKLKEQGMTHLILDLRNNPGGLVLAAVQSCSVFLPADTPIVTLEGRGGV